MSRTFNELSFTTLERITDAMVEAYYATPRAYQPLSLAIGGATSHFNDAMLLTTYGDTDLAYHQLVITRDKLVAALELVHEHLGLLEPRQAELVC